MSTWVVPGSPLEGGAGWRIWYSQPGDGGFEPAPVAVRLRGQPQATSPTWTLLPSVAGVGRRIGIGILKLDRPSPGATYEVDVPEAASPRPFQWQALPDRVGPDGVSFLLASCFFLDSDKEGAYSAGILDLRKRWNLAFKLLVGDQLYGDWPWDRKLRFGREPHVERYAERYAQYWGDEAYQAALQTTPNLVTCDDHEFWNNYPEPQPHIARTLTEADREGNRIAAGKLYDLYQASLNPDGQRWFTLAIPPVTFFVADTRSQRDPYRDAHATHPPRFMVPAQWRGLERWIQTLRGPGVLVLGQPLYLDRGSWKDYSLADFTREYERLWNLIEKSLRGENDDRKPHDILVLSGDIHTGRYSVGLLPNGLAPEGVPELIASPASMVQPGAKELSMPPSLVHVGPQNAPRRAADVHADRAKATLDNNVAVVRMVPGTTGRIRFELMVHSIRGYDARSWWDKARRVPPPPAQVREHSRTEVELR